MSGPDQACGRLHGLTRACISVQFVFNDATPIKSNLVNSKSSLVEIQFRNFSSKNKMTEMNLPPALKK